MENNQTQFLESLLSQIHSLKEQIENLESLVAGHLPSATVDEDLPEGTAPEEESLPIFEETGRKEEPLPVFEETGRKEEPLPVFEENGRKDEPLSVFGIKVDDAIEIVPIGEAHHAAGAVMDRMAEKESWRTDIPGPGVNDIRSAISLNDRILFINTLFHEDPVAFKDTLSALNGMPSFEDGVKFVLERHPEWNTGTDVVYRFMMAVRRKLK